MKNLFIIFNLTILLFHHILFNALIFKLYHYLFLIFNINIIMLRKIKKIYY